MFILFGTCNRVKKLNVFENDVCGVCHNPGRMQLYEISTWFTLFFIPIIKCTKEYCFECPACGATRKVSKAEAKQLIAASKNGGNTPAVNKNVRAVEGGSAPVNNVATRQNVAQTSHIQNNDTNVRALIREDIGRVLSSIKDPNVLNDSSNFNKLYASLKSGLSNKYGDGALVESVMKEYFEI